MADLRLPPRVLVAATVGLLLVVLLTAVRGPVARVALGSLAVAVAGLAAVVPLLRSDGIDWDWLPRRADDLPPEPGIATLRRLLDPGERDTAAAGQLHALVRTSAEERSGRPVDPAGGGPVARYLAGPPRPLTLDEVEAVVADLESLQPPDVAQEGP